MSVYDISRWYLTVPDPEPVEVIEDIDEEAVPPVVLPEEAEDDPEPDTTSDDTTDPEPPAQATAAIRDKVLEVVVRVNVRPTATLNGHPIPVTMGQR